MDNAQALEIIVRRQWKRNVRNLLISGVGLVGGAAAFLSYWKDDPVLSQAGLYTGIVSHVAFFFNFGKYHQRSGPVCWGRGLTRESYDASNRVIPIDQESDYDRANFFFINNFPFEVVGHTSDKYDDHKAVLKVDHFRTFDLEFETKYSPLSIRPLYAVVHNHTKKVLQFGSAII